ncbi:MAG: KH domain-containing protein [Proteobacteria bacterium]|nr:KH domain-containing protein [Pseudomonadota bacterium]MCZ6781978.1 KH domain-containing protein [Pseudomonadota bacterium]
MSDDGRAAANLIEFIAKSIVSEPEAVRVTPLDGGRLLELETADDDRGRVIGRQGRVAKAMRAVLAASRTGTGSAARLDIVD